MAEESPRGKNRRRYFRRKGGDKAPDGPVQPAPERAAAPAPRDESPNLERRVRPGRRKRRGRNRRGGETRVDTVAPSSERETEYQPPTSVFIYTHIVRPSSGAYEFRSEHFSKVGRTLDDYQIDIDPLFVPQDKEARRHEMEQIFSDWDFGEPEAAIEQPGNGPAQDAAPEDPSRPV